MLTSSAVAALVGAVVLGLTSYVPAFVQGSLGTTALVAGFTLSTMTIGWPLAAARSGWFYLRIGFRNTAMIGSVPVLAGTGLLTLLDERSPVWQVAGCCVLVGLGMGLIASPALISAQSSVTWAERGVVTGAYSFARSIGSAVGVAVFGALANAAAHDVAGSGPLAPEQLADAVAPVFVALLVTAVALAVTAATMPNRPAEQPDPT